MLLSILQAGINNSVLINDVIIHNNFEINAVSNDILKIQRVDGSTLYDIIEISFNSVDKTNILKTNNIDIVQSINNNAVAVNVYSTSEIDIGLNLKSDKLYTYLKTGVYVFYLFYKLV